MGELAHGDNEPGAQQAQFALQPAGTITDFDRIRHAIAATLILPRKAAAHRRHVDAGTKRGLIETERAKPAKERFSRSPGERLLHIDFPRTGRLSDQHHGRDHGFPEHRTPDHVRATRAPRNAALMAPQGLPDWHGRCQY